MKRLLALVIAVGFLAGMIGCTGSTTTKPAVPKGGSVEPTHGVGPMPSKRDHVTTPTHAAEPTKKTELPPVTTHKDTGKETKKQ